MSGRRDKPYNFRTANAMRALKDYPSSVSDPNADHQQWLGDLLADLMHLAKARKGYAQINKRYLNFNAALETARGHFNEEDADARNCPVCFNGDLDAHSLACPNRKGGAR